MKNKKGALPLRFLLSLLFSIILFVAVFSTACSFGKNLFRLSSAGEKSFKQLVKDIDIINNGGGEAKTIRMTVDRGTMIVGFAAGEKDTYATGGYIVKGESGTSDSCASEKDTPVSYAARAVITRPADVGCDINSACICRCKSANHVYEPDEIINQKAEKQYTYRLSCESAVCESKDIALADTGNMHINKLSGGTLSCLNFENGFIIAGAKVPFCAPSGMYSECDPAYPSTGSSRSVTIQATSDGGIAVCENAADGKCIP